MNTPPTLWREQVAPDEAERFARYAQQFAAMQRAKSAKFGPGRALHRKQQLGLTGVLQVLPDLPVFAQQGLFAQPRSFETWVRLSNGGTDKAADAKPDVRGFSLQVRGVNGTAALGGACQHQDFTLIQHPAFAFAKTDEFVGLVLSVSQSPLKLLGYLVKRYGLGGSLRQLKKIAATFGKPFKGFAAETFYSAAPIACGPYAARVRLQPLGTPPATPQGSGWAAHVSQHLRQAPLVYALQLQFFVDEATTPIEDASVDWPESTAPYLIVAQLTLPQQDADSTAGQALGQAIEQTIFDPWAALVEHRPLGDVMRARKVVYFESQKGRGAA